MMMVEEAIPAGESRDGKGSGDRDRDYVWGCPRMGLTLMQQARLQIMRGYILDFRQGEPGGAADGDTDYVQAIESGLLIPSEPDS